MNEYDSNQKQINKKINNILSMKKEDKNEKIEENIKLQEEIRNDINNH